MAVLFQDARVRLNANRTRTYGPVTVPAPGYTRLRVTLDLSDADQVDPSKFLAVTIEASADGVAWIPWGGITTTGSTAPERAAKVTGPVEFRLPWIEMPCPPVGWQMRATYQTGATAVVVGVIVEGF